MVVALDARLELGRGEVGAGDTLAYEIANKGTATLVCGYAYRLERQDERGWTVINQGMAFRAIGLLVEPGNKRQLKAEIPVGTKSGDYRISTTVRQEPLASSPPLNLTAPFQVR